jgi:hypothetical protein
MFDRKRQNSNAGKGSKLQAAGASVYQQSQMSIQEKIITKNPIVPA